MMAGAVSKSKRFNEIFHILLAHDFAGLLRDIGRWQSRQPSAIPGVNGTPEDPVPGRVRRLLEDLGPTFIKIGQLLGTRPDLIPQPFVEEFKKLYDETRPAPFSEIQAMLERELRRPLKEVFSEFEEVPIASASIGQVHRARTRTGEKVAVKVRRPGIEARMRTDFEILGILVRFTERVFAATRVWQPSEHLEEVRLMLDKELDYRHELRIQKLVESNLADVPEVKIPHAYESLCTRRVLVMEFVDGMKFRAALTNPPPGLDRKNLARIITFAMARQIFLDRLFHADPSPGNILIIDSQHVCFLDFGAFGVVTKRRSRLILDLLMGLTAANTEEIARVIVELCDVRGEYDPKKFLRDVERIADYHEREKASPADPVLLQMLVDVARAHRMVLPPDFMLITRALYQFDGMCKALDPDFELVDTLKPYVNTLLKDRILDPDLQLEALRTAGLELAKFATHLPGHLEKILLRLERGELSTQIELKGMHDYKVHQMRMIVILSFTVLLGLLIIGGAIAFGLGGKSFLLDYWFGSLIALMGWGLVVLYASGLFRSSRF